ncbi:TetR/AcrR family transcriptional regulator [Gryllotalpicola protaetiae]|uniref:TetR/AcrR family transcriptional regulator n=1 Tax=Gryllotalpicola protaetiae TaxID=2419771 RepID=A0A387BTF9_9MICO|nr:TetR/AcrR family transcriptional regulator [Gryllotalpicola protaetiae]AYG04350.1 TetR/AcrR family transcriptional regulator [Gryllotalpicola protaetiae]
MPRSLRADAQANYERLLDVSARVFARDGADTSMKAIAAEAGVGIATLYRRFPTRDDLIEATYRSRTEQLCAAAPELLEHTEPIGALRDWMEQFVDYMLTKQGMADALPAILAARDGLRAHSREALLQAMTALVEAGVTAGRLRPDASPSDILMAIGGITLISGHESDRQLATRLIDQLLGGLLSRVAER